MLTWLHPYAVTDELLSRTDEKLDCLRASNQANGNLNSMCQKTLRIKMWAIIATFYVSMARQQGFCIKLWPMEKGWVCETVISLIYQAGHLMTDNFNFSVKLADWLLKHPSLLTGMAVSGYLLLEPSNSPPPALLILISSSKESGLDPNHSSPSRSRAVMASHGLNVTLSPPLWKGPCAHEKTKVLGGLCTLRTKWCLWGRCGSKNQRDFTLYGMNTWFRSADFGPESFLFSS